MSEPVQVEVPVPLPLRTVNAWIFPGDPAAIVDCGIGTPEGYEALRSGLWDSGIDAYTARLLITHGHVDHAGNAARLRSEFGIHLHACAAESAFVETFERDAARRNDAFAKALAAHGAPTAAVAAIRERGRAIDAMMQDVPISHPLEEGQRLRLGDLDATVHFAPGHTPGSVLLLTEGNHLVSGDTLLEHITSNAIELLDRDRGRYAQYLRTLDGLRRFVGCKVLPGHHASFVLTQAILDNHLDKHRKRGAKVLAGLERPKTAWQVMQDVLPNLAHGQEFLGMCEAVGHLHALEEEGKARMQEKDGLRRFVKV